MPTMPQCGAMYQVTLDESSRANDYPQLCAEVIITGPHELRLCRPDGSYAQLQGTDAGLHHLLVNLDGRHSWASTVQALPPSQRRHATAIRKQLTCWGLIALEPTRPAPTVGIMGRTRLAHLIASRLAQGTDARLVLIGESTCLAHQLRAHQPPHLACVPGLDSLARVTAVDVVIVASETIEPDRAVLHALHRDGHPHVSVQAHGDSAVIGPLIQPGRTPCHRCADMYRVDADSDWLEVLARQTNSLADQRGPVVAAAAHGVTALVTHLWEDQKPIMWRLNGATKWSEPVWPAHPDCGCLPNALPLAA